MKPDVNPFGLKYLVYCKQGMLHNRDTVVLEDFCN